VWAIQKTCSNIILENKGNLYHVKYVHTYMERFVSFHSN
jgi:hypothetical protein